MSAILAIESAISDGSLCVFAEGKVIARHVGSGRAGRAEELLQNVDTLLQTARTGLSGIEKVAVSTGPGSYTGIRVGIATGLGLAFSSGIPCVGLTVFEALASQVAYQGSVLALVQTRAEEVGWQLFHKSDRVITAVENSETGTYDQLIEAIDGQKAKYVAVGDLLASRLEETASGRNRFEINSISGTPAEWIAAAASRGFGSEPRPSYLNASTGGRF